MKPVLSAAQAHGISANIKSDADILFAAARKLMEAYEILGNYQGPPSVELNGSAPKTTTTTPPVKETLSRADPLYDVLKAHGSKMGRLDILKAAQKAGSKISKPDTASVYMSGDKRFCKAGYGQWALSEWPKTS